MNGEENWGMKNGMNDENITNLMMNAKRIWSNFESADTNDH